MGTFSRIGVVFLIALSFTGGLVIRANYEHRTESLAARKKPQAINNMLASVDGANVDFSPVQTLYEVLRNLREHYVEQLTSKDEGKMSYDAIRYMLSSLKDPNTRFLDPDQRKVVEDQIEGKFHGIGAILSIKSIKSGSMINEHLIVVDTLPNSPAASAGLNTGDDITAVNGKNVLAFDPFQKIDKMVADSRKATADINILRKEFEAEQKRIENGMPVMEAENMLMSGDTKSIDLTVLPRGSKKEVKIKVQPSEFAVEPVTSKLIEGDKCGYIKINCFTIHTAERFATAMKEMMGQNLDGLVLDLRGVSGGETDIALQIAKWFVPGQQFAYVARARDRKTAIKIPSAGGEGVWHKPLVVLVDKGTARLPEVLAAALKDNGAARLIGEKTFGDFTEVTMIDLADGSAYTMTTGAFLTAKGAKHGSKGLAVDSDVSSLRNDDQLKEAVKTLRTIGNRS